MEWPGYALLGMAGALALTAPVLTRALREVRLSRAGLSNVDKMADADMVLHMARLFGALGYRVYRAPASEPAFDLILVDGLGQRRGVVVRHWRERVDAPAVQAAAEAAGRIDHAEPMIVSVAGYTLQAKQAAVATGTILWALAELTEAIGRVRQSAVAYPELPALNDGQGGNDQVAVPLRAVLQAPPREAPPSAGVPYVPPRRRPERNRPGDSWVEPGTAPRCPRCGRRMVVRRSAEGEYWGCPTFPRCLGTRQKR
ncbi:MAG TPA: restriction endonuclease [Symbiobacteriaceae bacterium]|nr:restriction endonuclease [Symbiobacteriaceae bacterium]